MRIVRKTQYFFRFKYRKGSNIHSPFVYNLVREVFMPNTSASLSVDKDMLNQFCTENVKPRHAVRWCQLSDYMHLENYTVDPKQYNNEDLVVITSIHCVDSLNKIMEDMEATEQRVVMVINGISKNENSRKWWQTISDNVILDFNSFGVIVFDKMLSDKKYKLKL